LPALALGVVLSVSAPPHIYAQDLSVLALLCIIVASRRGNVAMLIMLALSAVAVVGFLEIQRVLRLLPEAVLLMAALVLDDLRALTTASSAQPPAGSRSFLVNHSRVMSARCIRWAGLPERDSS
jgi:hypothetical protein